MPLHEVVIASARAYLWGYLAEDEAHTFVPGLLNLPLFPRNTLVPRHLPVTRWRHALYLCWTDGNSLAGATLQVLSFALILASVLTFGFSTLPRLRLRAEDGVVGYEERAIDAVDWAVLAYFTLDYVCRFFTWTAKPSKEELAAVTAYAARDAALLKAEETAAKDAAADAGASAAAVARGSGGVVTGG